MLSVMLWMVSAGIRESASSPLTLKITKVLEGMVVTALRGLPSQPREPRLYILTVTCKHKATGNMIDNQVNTSLTTGENDSKET